MTKHRWAARAMTAVLIVAAVAIVPASRAAVDADGGGLFVQAIVRTVVNVDRRGDAYRSIGRQRDEDVAAVDQTLALRQAQLDTKQISQDRFDAEKTRLAALRQAIIDRAEREKQVNKFVYNRAIGDEWRGAAQAALLAASVGDGSLGRFVNNLLNGQDPVEAGLAELSDKLRARLSQALADRLPDLTAEEDALRLDVAGRLQVLREDFREQNAERMERIRRANSIVALMRDPGGRIRAELRRVEQLLDTGEGQTSPLLTEEATAQLRSMVDRLRSAQAQWVQLRGQRPRVNVDRLLRDAEWNRLTIEIMDNGSVPVAVRMAAAASIPRVREALDRIAGDRPLTAEQRTSLLVTLLADHLAAERTRAAGAPTPFDLDRRVRELLAQIDASAPTTLFLEEVPDDAAPPDDGADTSTFSASFGDPSTPEAQQYIVSSDNVVIMDEGNVVFWQPAVGADQEAAAPVGTIVYRIPLPGRIASGDLRMTIGTFHWDYSQGWAAIDGSTDGENWQTLAQLDPPPFSEGSGGGPNGQIPEMFLGATEVWLRVRLWAAGPSADEGGVWTNTAQHARYDRATGGETFRLEVVLDP